MSDGGAANPAAAPALPNIVYVRVAAAANVAELDDLADRASERPPRALAADDARRALQSGAIAGDADVFFHGLDDWTPAREVAALWVPIDGLSAGASLVDSAPPSSADSAPVSSRKSLRPSSRAHASKAGGALAIVAAIAGGVGLLGLGAAVVYATYFRFVPTAIRHLPKKCVASARIDASEWLHFKPFTDAILPTPLGPGKSGGSGPDLRERLRAHAGINLDRDVREVAVCLYDDPSIAVSAALSSGTPIVDPLHGLRFVVAIGGRFRTGAVAGLHEALRGEPFALGYRLEGVGETAVIRLPTSLGLGGVIGQARDGTLLFAPNDAALAAARELRAEDDARAQTGLRGEGALEARFGHASIAKMRALVPEKIVAGEVTEPLGHAREGRIVLTFGAQPRLTLELEAPGESDAKAIERALHLLLKLATDALGKLPEDHVGEHASVAAATPQRDDNRVDVRFALRTDALTRGAHELADALRDPASTLHSKAIPSLRIELGLDPRPAASPSTSTSSSADGHPAPHASSAPRLPASADPSDEGDD